MKFGFEIVEHIQASDIFFYNEKYNHEECTVGNGDSMIATGSQMCSE
jgi:hypothetical protein